jgi:hypothetical protein
LTTPLAADRIAVLERQQAIQTAGVLRMLSGQWTGFPSLVAELDALSPGIQLQPRPPLRQSEAPPPAPTWWATFEANRGMPTVQQWRAWTCSACALEWLLHATGLDPHVTRNQVIYDKIGHPRQINEWDGLTNIDGPGQALRWVLESYGIQTKQAWLSFDQVYALAGQTTALMSGGEWYHWTAVRGRDGANLWIANSAEDYMDVWSSLSRSDFGRLGPFNVVSLVR